MGVFNSLNIGINGLLAQTSKISTISDNIANVNTVGYKGFVSSFSSMMDNLQPVNTYTPGGVSTISQQLNTTQGDVTKTQVPTDIAISGNGFFTVTADTVAGSTLYFTRAGSFTPDKNGNLINGAGFYLQGWPLDAQGNLPLALQSPNYGVSSATSALQLVNISTLASTPTPTTTLAPRINLDATATAYDPSGHISFLSNPDPGDTITLNGVSWSFVASGAVGNQTNIGADLAATMTQLAGDLTASTDPSLLKASYTAAPTQLLINYTDPDGAGNTYTIASGSANGIASSPTLSVIYDPTSDTQSMASGAILPSYTKPLDIIDNNGVKHTVAMSFLKTANDTWSVELYAVPASDVASTARTDGEIANGTIVFNGDGSLASVSPSLTSSITFPWASTGTIPTGATAATTDNSVAFNWGTAGVPFGTPGATIIGKNDGMEQFDKAYTVIAINQDGSQSSSFKDVTISDGGIVVADYTDGSSHQLYRIPLANFYNPDDLTNVNGNVYLDNSNSSLINFYGSDTGGVGTITGSTLEASNVDLPTQMSDIIIAQNAYQANSKLISTTDEMMQTLTQMLG